MTYERTDSSDRHPATQYVRCDLLGVESVHCEQLWMIPDADASVHTLLVITEGMGVVWLGDDKHSVSIGKCFLALPGTTVKVSPHFNQVGFFRILFDRLIEVERTNGTRLYKKTSGGDFLDPGELIIPSPGRMLELAQGLHQCSLAHDIGSAYRKTMLFHEMLYELIQAATHSDAQLTKQAVQRTIRHIALNFGLDLTRNKLAEMAMLSPEYYSQLFKKISGKSVTDYLTHTRIRHAQERLVSSQERLSDIAKKVGYKDEYYLSRKFKQVVGVSPTAYLKLPKKIISLNPHLTRHLLTLDVIPAATVCYPWKFGEHQERLDAADCECRDWTVDFAEDELRSMKPDLLLCLDNISPDKLRLYSSIAPTLVISWYGSDWRGHLRTIARAVGKAQEASDCLSRFAAKAEQARAQIHRNANAAQTVSILNIRSETSFVYKNRGMGSQVVYEELQLKMPDVLRHASTDKSSIPVELDELLPAYAADHLLIAVEHSEAARRRTEQLLGNDRWLSYAANRTGSIHLAHMERWHGYDLLSIEWQLDEWLRLLAYDSPNKFL
ncbi:AraC family transcriptional regulator [Paenibacillus hodogayensis]|uniref:AraC family transcriptional regulator n=1 Tax=Paenibacillus hodogayensis TaxID=279208 RepID=A0ABV5VXN5_9BACL